MDSFGDIKMLACVTRMGGWLALPLASSNDMYFQQTFKE